MRAAHFRGRKAGPQRQTEIELPKVLLGEISTQGSTGLMQAAPKGGDSMTSAMARMRRNGSVPLGLLEWMSNFTAYAKKSLEGRDAKPGRVQ